MSRWEQDLEDWADDSEFLTVLQHGYDRSVRGAVLTPEEFRSAKPRRILCDEKEPNR